MSLSSSDRRYHRIYEALPNAYSVIIDDLFRTVFVELRTRTPVSSVYLFAETDDRAEACVAALTRYLIESNPEDAAIKAAIAEVDAP